MSSASPDRRAPAGGTTNSDAQEGLKSVRSRPIADNQSNILEITHTVRAGFVSFFVRTSSEEGFDFLRFELVRTADGGADGELVASDQFSGIRDWSYKIFAVPDQDEYKFRWTYEKDGSEADGEDRAWVDGITFPPIVANPNDPVAVNDTIEVIANIPTQFNVLDNDFDDDGDRLIELQLWKVNAIQWPRIPRMSYTRSSARTESAVFRLFEAPRTGSIRSIALFSTSSFGIGFSGVHRTAGVNCDIEWPSVVAIPVKGRRRARPESWMRYSRGSRAG